MSETATETETVELPVHECWELLRRARVGRLAVLADGRPHIFPLNHVVDQGTLVFRTAPGTKLAAAVGSPVAFEVDGQDDDAGQVWSVVVQGRAREVRRFYELIDTAELPLSSWQAGPKPRFVRIEPEHVTGRCFPLADRPGG